MAWRCLIVCFSPWVPNPENTEWVLNFHILLSRHGFHLLVSASLLIESEMYCLRCGDFCTVSNLNWTSFLSRLVETVLALELTIPRKAASSVYEVPQWLQSLISAVL